MRGRLLYAKSCRCGQQTMLLNIVKTIELKMAKRVEIHPIFQISKLMEEEKTQIGKGMKECGYENVNDDAKKTGDENDDNAGI